MLQRTVAVPVLAAGLLGVALVGGGGRVPDATSAQQEETTILLLADGPLTPGPVPSPPPLDRADGEVVVNAALVPETTIQTGLHMRLLYAGPAQGRSTSVVEWPAGVSLRRHWHPVTERLWMIEGTIASPADGELGPGTFWEAPARVAMGPFSSTGATFVFLGEGTFETRYLDAETSAPRPGASLAVDPDSMPWRPPGEVLGADFHGAVKVLSPGTGTDRSVYLVRLDSTEASPSYTGFGANVEGYVLSGSVRLSDPYHGVHLLAPGFYFRIPSGFPARLSAASG